MKNNKLFFCVFVFLLIIPFTIGVQPSQQYNKILLSPFYVSAMTQNVQYNYSVNVFTPDGISEVKSAIITLDAWVNPTRTFNAWMNNVQCNTKNYTISTSYASAGRGVVTFDCTNAISPNKNNSVRFVVSGGNIGASTAWLDLTYMNNPVGEVNVHGTEYTSGQNAKLWLQLLNSTGGAVINGVCYVDIYNPDGSIFLERATMSNMVHDGVYYYDLVAPNPSGVYPAIATCYYVATQNPRVFTSYSLTSGVVKSGTIANTQVLDGSYLVLSTNKNGGLTINNRVNATFNSSSFYSNCGNVSSSLLTGLTIYWNGKWNTGTSNHNVYLYLYNYSSSSYVLLPNFISGGNGGATQVITNSIALTNFTTALGLNSSNNMMIKVADTDFNEGSKDLSTDYLYASCDQLGSPSFQEIKGSSEMHITNPLQYILSSEDDSYTINNSVSTTLANGTIITETYYTGIFVNQFELSSATSSSLNVLVEYQGLHSIPCNSVITFYYINSSGYYVYPFTTQRQTTEDHCSINFNFTFAKDGIYLFEAHARNVWESDIRSTNTGILASYPLISVACDYWAISHNETPYPYIVPKNQSNENHSAFYRACNNYYDNFYWFNSTYSSAVLAKSGIVDEQGFVQYEADYFSLKFAGDKLNMISSLLTDNVVSTGMYSQILLLNPLGRNISDTQFWANLSTTQLDLMVDVLTPSNVWNYTNRNLTYYPSVNFSVNNSEIASGVWNYSSRNLTYYPSVNFSVNNSEIVSGVWNYSERNLTFYPAQTDLTNYSRISNLTASDVWNYTGTIQVNLLSQIANSVWGFVARYTHGVILN